jgi:hypothetical protein
MSSSASSISTSSADVETSNNNEIAADTGWCKHPDRKLADLLCFLLQHGAPAFHLAALDAWEQQTVCSASTTTTNNQRTAAKNVLSTTSQCRRRKRHLVGNNTPIAQVRGQVCLEEQQPCPESLDFDFVPGRIEESNTEVQYVPGKIVPRNADSRNSVHLCQVAFVPADGIQVQRDPITGNASGLVFHDGGFVPCHALKTHCRCTPCRYRFDPGKLLFHPIRGLEIVGQGIVRIESHGLTHPKVAKCSRHHTSNHRGSSFSNDNNNSSSSSISSIDSSSSDNSSSNSGNSSSNDNSSSSNTSQSRGCTAGDNLISRRFDSGPTTEHQWHCVRRCDNNNLQSYSLAQEQPFCDRWHRLNVYSSSSLSSSLEEQVNDSVDNSSSLLVHCCAKHSWNRNYSMATAEHHHSNLQHQHSNLHHQPFPSVFVEFLLCLFQIPRATLGRLVREETWLQVTHQRAARGKMHRKFLIRCLFVQNSGNTTKNSLSEWLVQWHLTLDRSKDEATLLPSLPNRFCGVPRRNGNLEITTLLENKDDCSFVARKCKSLLQAVRQETQRLRQYGQYHPYLYPCLPTLGFAIAAAYYSCIHWKPHKLLKVATVTNENEPQETKPSAEALKEKVSSKKTRKKGKRK